MDNYINSYQSGNQNSLYEKYKNITNISEIPHKYLIQQNPNEFLYKTNIKIIYGFLIALIIVGVMLGGLICILIFNLNVDLWAICFSFAVVGFGFLGVIYNLLSLAIKIKIFLEPDGIEIVYVLLFFCIPIKKKYTYGDRVKFENERAYENISRIIINDNSKKKYIKEMELYNEEAEFLVYILNKHLDLLNLNYSPWS